MAHLLAVCAMVQMVSDDEDIAIAALLHDSLEDKPAEISRAEIREKFGEHVLQIIEISSDTPPDFAGGEKPDWDMRKTAYIAHIRNADPALLDVSVADKVDNARSILADHRRIGDEVWKRFNRGKEKQIWYYTEVTRAFQEADYQGDLLQELKKLVKNLQDL